MDVSEFVAQVNGAGGLARLNRYQVLIYTAPLEQASTNIANAVQAIDEFGGDDGTDWIDYCIADADATALRLTAFCERTQLPGYQYQTDNQRIYGPSFKFPHKPEWADITMSFLVGADLNEKYFFEAWQNMVMDPISHNFNYLNEYTADIDLVIFDDYDNTNYWTSLIDAWPISVSEIGLASDDNNSVMKIQVTFTYKFASWYSGSHKQMGVKGAQQLFGQTVRANPGVGNAP